MKLIIAEKPSVAQSISAVLGAKERGDGFLHGSGYIVSWCAGHLIELADADAYDAKYVKWKQADLPILPNPWKLKADEKKKKLLSVLDALMKRPDVTEIICATDAGREGEYYVELDQASGKNGPVLRGKRSRVTREGPVHKTPMVN